MMHQSPTLSPTGQQMVPPGKNYNNYKSIKIINQQQPYAKGKGTNGQQQTNQFGSRMSHNSVNQPMKKSAGSTNGNKQQQQ